MYMCIAPLILKRPMSSFLILRKRQKIFLFHSSPFKNFKYQSMVLLLAILDTTFFSLD